MVASFLNRKLMIIHQRKNILAQREVNQLADFLRIGAPEAVQKMSVRSDIFARQHPMDVRP
jgi:hypothetical protein